jgi:Fe2+ or Zn2+ uptake regulation protein
VTCLREMFAQHGLRCTRQREQVYAALVASKAHPTAEELFQAVRGGDEGLSLATVYNTLEAFTRVGLCRRLSAAGGVCRYDGMADEHVHLVTGDGRIMDVPEDLSGRILGGLSPEVLAELEQRMGVRVRGVTVQVVAEPIEKGAGTLN